MTDTNGALRSLEQSSAMVGGRLNLLEHDLRQVEFKLTEEKKKTKNLEEALHNEFLRKKSYKKSAEVSLMGMFLCCVCLFVVLVVTFLPWILK